MKRNYIGGLYMAVLLAATSLTTPFPAFAQGTDKPAPKSEKPAAKPETKEARPYPFHGKLGAIDKEKKTLTIMGKEKSRILYVNAKTKIERANKTATLDDAKVGEEIAGRVTKTSDGREILVNLRLGPKPASGEKPKKEKPAKDNPAK